MPINIVGSSTGNLKSEPKVLSENEKKEKLLQKLLQSAKPHDLRAANLLIQTMVKEVKLNIVFILWNSFIFNG